MFNYGESDMDLAEDRDFDPDYYLDDEPFSDEGSCYDDGELRRDDYYCDESFSDFCEARGPVEPWEWN